MKSQKTVKRKPPPYYPCLQPAVPPGMSACVYRGVCQSRVARLEMVSAACYYRQYCSNLLAHYFAHVQVILEVNTQDGP